MRVIAVYQPDAGQPRECAWLKDKLGVSWQIVRRVLNELLTDPDGDKAGLVMQAISTRCAYAGD